MELSPIVLNKRLHCEVTVLNEVICEFLKTTLNLFRCGVSDFVSLIVLVFLLSVTETTFSVCALERNVYRESKFVFI